MDTKKLIALLLIGLLAAIYVVNRGMLDRIELDILITTITASKSIMLLGATALGVVIGVLLK
jgi:hypothetical protein